MKKEDIKTLIIFIISIVVIIALFIYNNSNNKNTPTDRKVNYIFNTFSYDNVLKEGKNLFFK